MNMKNFTLLFLTFGALLVSGICTVNPGPKYPPTRGEVWPKPQQQVKGTTFYTFDPWLFKVTITNHSCEILAAAVERYSYIVKRSHGLRARARKSGSNLRARNHKATTGGVVRPAGQHEGLMTELKVVLTAPCEDYPSFGMDERYSLDVTNVSTLESGSVWGLIRGLETFAQLFYLSADYDEIRINTTSIVDFPSYPHRGLLLDTGRHYITVPNILKTLDAMAMNKMNVFHWHIVDDQSFPYQSEKFPELSEKGAFHSSMVYTKEDIERVVQYARARGIRVIPEFDIPGHTRSWGAAYPGVLTQCYSTDSEVVGLGPMDPLSHDALNLLKDLIAEVQQRFPDKSIHIGGDEVDLHCWSTNPRLAEYMRRHSMTTAGLLALFVRNAMLLLGNDTDVIVWQEVFDENVPLPKKTIIQVWKWTSTIEMIVALLSGYRVLFSSDWYLSSLDSEWTDFYKSDPRRMVYDVLGNDTLLANIVGGEACMWGEMVDDRNLISRVWPRASAIAENLWSSNPKLWDGGAPGNSQRAIPDEVYRRIEEHACRMIRRGVGAQPPSGPGYCVA